MPVTLPDDVAASLLAALAGFDASSLPSSFGDLHNILLTTQPNAAAGHQPTNSSSQHRTLASRTGASASRPQIYTLPSQRLALTNTPPSLQYSGRRASSVPLANRPLWEGFSRGSIPTRADVVNMSPLPSTTTPTRAIARAAETSTPVSDTSSPTLYGSSPDIHTPHCNPTPPGRLSPLRFDYDSGDSDDTRMDIGDFQPNPLHGKRPASAIEDSDSDSEEEQPLMQLYLKRAALRSRAAAAGDGGGAGGGAGDVPVARWPCPRKGDAARVGEAQDIGVMPCNEPDCDECTNSNDPTYNEGRTRSKKKNNGQKGSRKQPRLAIEKAWTTSPDGAPVTLRAGYLLSQFLSVFGLAQRTALDKILESGSTHMPVTASPSSFDIRTIVAHIKAQTETLQMTELHYMLTLVQLALSIDCMQRDRGMKGVPKMMQDDLSQTYSAGTPRRTFVNWLTWGQRLLHLCSAGTMYVLPIIAATNMRTQITGETSSPTDIGSLANALRQVKHGMWLPMVRRFMMPIKFMLSHQGYLRSLQLNYDIPGGESGERRSELLAFHEVDRLDDILARVETNLYKLPSRSVEWNMTKTLPWTRTRDPREVQLPKLRKVKTPLVFKKTSSPVNAENRECFTEEQRGFASKATVVTSMDDFIKKSSELHAGGKVTLKKYIEMNSKMLNGEALHVSDSNDEFMFLFYRVPEDFRQQLVHAIEAIHAAMPGEFKDEDSRREFFKYLSVHYVWYAL
ncbi:hypothetical protein C8R47DRAFT_1228859 [Mycena vitilis]|nr:hypothetical protein C8R47DRAFT_1228859 [Mycena vitilis]